MTVTPANRPHMRRVRRKLYLMLFSATGIAALAPVAFSSEHGVSGSAAVCNTCCTEATSTCIVGDIRTNNAYDNGPAKCAPVNST